MKRKLILFLTVQFIFLLKSYAQIPSDIDLVLLNGKVITVDHHFSILEAVAIKGDRIVAVGSTNEIRKFASNKTKIIDLGGRTVVPGLIDFHAHPEGASISELEEEIPDVHSIADVLNWIRMQSQMKKPGEWIRYPKLFFTRLKELRQPSLAELDSVAPQNPVFLNGSYGGMINTAAMRASGITAATQNPGIAKDKIGALTGFIRSSAFGLLKLPPQKSISAQERMNALETMLKKYNEYGVTSVCSGGGDYTTFTTYQELNKLNRLTARIFQNIILSKPASINTLIDTLKSFKFSTGYGDSMVRIGAIKLTLDGGILTGTAYMRKPWGKKAQEIFGFEDSMYRGVINYTKDELIAFVKVANELNWKFTAHCTGGGGVDLLLDVFDEVNKLKPIRPRRFSIIHGNFFTYPSMMRMNALGVYADVQPAWFYKDADAMKYILDAETLRTFHPYADMVEAGVTLNGGSDHMVKLDANTSINPYNPFLAMWTAITRKTERGTGITLAQGISRELALEMYTINNAYGSFEESLKGSIEPGKLADLAVLSDDYLNCPVDAIKNIKSELTILGGKIVYDSGKLKSAARNSFMQRKSLTK